MKFCCCRVIISVTDGILWRSGKPRLHWANRELVEKAHLGWEVKPISQIEFISEFNSMKMFYGNLFGLTALVVYPGQSDKSTNHHGHQPNHSTSSVESCRSTEMKNSQFLLLTSSFRFISHFLSHWLRTIKEFTIGLCFSLYLYFSCVHGIFWFVLFFSSVLSLSCIKNSNHSLIT